MSKFDISAKFSLLSRATPSNILPVIANAESFLAAHPPGSNPIGADAKLGAQIQTQIDMYCNPYDCP